MLSIGCDFGLRKSGIVILNDKFEIETQDLIRVHEKIKGAQRLLDIETAFHFIVEPFRDQEIEVFVEGYAYGAKYQRESLAELGGVMRRYLHLHNMTFWIIPPTSLKLFVTGTGKATKNYMKKCTKEQWDQVFKSDDVCDAYGMSRLGMTLMKSNRGTQGWAHLHDAGRGVITDILQHPEYYRNSNTAKKRPNAKAQRKTQGQRLNQATNISRSNREVLNAGS